MKNASCFFDTNILLYLLSGDTFRADRAEALVAKGGIISVQVLNEFTSVAARKFGMAYAEIRESLATIRAICKVQPVSIETHDLALAMAERYGFSFYDCLIVSAALLSGCATLYSEDMQDGHEIEGKLLIANPFS